MSNPEDQFIQGDASPLDLVKAGLDPFTGKPFSTPMANYMTHDVRFSDSSAYDEICTKCGARNNTPGVDELEKYSCAERQAENQPR